MNRPLLTVFFASVLVTAAAGTAWVAQRGEAKSVLEAVVETYQFHKADQTPMDVSIRRRVVSVPEEYGTLVHITENGDWVTLWYDNEGTLRNFRIRANDVVVRRGVLYYDENPE